SAAKPSRMRLVASHISSDTALCRSGLLKVTIPTPPSLRASILSVWAILFPSKMHRVYSVILRCPRAARASKDVGRGCRPSRLGAPRRAPQGDVLNRHLPSYGLRLMQGGNIARV